MAVPPARLTRTALLFTMGSGALLVGAVGFARSGWMGYLVILPLAWTAVAFHFLGLFHLYFDASLDPGGRTMRAAGGTVLGFFAGLLATGVSLPRGFEWMFLALPYLPFVFGPVIVVHAVLFLSVSEKLPSGHDRTLVRAGCYFLVAIAGVGTFGQTLHAVAGAQVLPSPWAEIVFAVFLATFLPYPAGLTAFGYGLIWVGYGTTAIREKPPLEEPPQHRPAEGGVRRA